MPHDPAPRIDLAAERKKREPVWPEPQPLPSRGAVGTADPFPIDLLPAPLQAAATEAARFVKAPLAAPALVGLSVVATAIGKRAIVEERAGLVHFPALFLVGVADSGERKSPIFRLMTEPLEDWCEQQTASWEIAARKARARNAAIDHATQAARKKAKGKEDLESAARTIADLESERVAVPPPPRLFTTDTTEQRVFQLMHDRGGAFAVMSGEGRPVLDAIMGKYSGDNRTGDAIYLAGISGDTITRDRVGTAEGGGPESRTIRRPCLNVCILVQPDKYLEAAAHPALRASGALARIWPVWLPSLVGRRFENDGEPGLNQGRTKPFAALVHQLLKHDPPLLGTLRFAHPGAAKVAINAEGRTRSAGPTPRR